MGRIAIITAALAASSACCREINGHSSGDTTGNTAATTGGAALVETVASQQATPAAIDCGAFIAPYEHSSPGVWLNWDAGAFEAGVSCVLDATDAGKPFVMLVTRTGLDFQTVYAYLAGPDGVAWVLWQSHEPNSPANTGACVTDVDGVTCAPELEPGVLAPDIGIDDGGIRGLGCPDAGSTIVVSPGDPQCEL